MISVAALSDLHGNWELLNGVYPDIELVILAGDLCATDRLEDQEKEVPEIISKLWSIFPRAEKILIVPGNHDFYLEKLWRKKDLVSLRIFLGHDVELLVDQTWEFLGSDGKTYRIYGNPRTDLSYWAFPRFYGDIQRIPRHLDILVTHDCPRFYQLTCVKNSIGCYGNEEPGSKELAERVEKVKPKYHIFGHIHERCFWDSGITKFYNVSQMHRDNPSPEIVFISIPSENG